MISFNLVDEAWLPLLDSKGDIHELSLRQALKKAHEYRKIQTDSPCMTISLYRFLQAVSIAIFHIIDDEEEWFELWDQKKFDPDKIDAYLDKWKHRFDLFDKERPFYQHTKLLVDSPIHIRALELETYSPGNKTVFDHTLVYEQEHLEMGYLARALMTAQNYSLGGGVSFTDCNLKKEKFNFCESNYISGIIFWVIEENIFKMLMMNSAPQSDLLFDNKNLGWEKDDLIHSEIRSAIDYADYLTWQSRRFRFELKTDEVINNTISTEQLKLFRSMGDKLDGEFHEPMFAYRRSRKDNGTYPLKYNRARDLWRDIDILYSYVNDSKGVPPANLVSVTNLAENLNINRINLESFGVINDQARMVHVRNDIMPYFPAICIDQGKQNALVEILIFAEKQERILYFALLELGRLILYSGKDINERLSKEEKNDVEDFINRNGSIHNYWSSLETKFYANLEKLSHINEAEKFNEFREDWKDTLYSTAKTAFDNSVKHIDANAKQLKAISIARNKLYHLKQEKDDE